MKWIKRIFIFLLIVTTATLIHYYLPQRDIVKVVDTEVIYLNRAREWENGCLSQ